MPSFDGNYSEGERHQMTILTLPFADPLLGCVLKLSGRSSASLGVTAVRIQGTGYPVRALLFPRHSVFLSIVGLFSCPSNHCRKVREFCILSSVRVIVTRRLSPSAFFRDGPVRRQIRAAV